MSEDLHLRWVACEYLVEGDRVRMKEDPNETGIVISEDMRGYVIHFDGGDYNTIPAQELEVLEDRA